MRSGRHWPSRRRDKRPTGAGSSNTIQASPSRFALPLLLRGSESDLLSVQTAAAMRTRGPKPRLIEFAGVGHAPMLFNPEQIAPVVAFLGAA